MMRFAVIGHPVGHSLSPAMHRANFRALGFAADYVACDVAPADLPAAVRRFVAEGYRGFNCTIPHKEQVMPLLDGLDASAVRCGAVNTVTIDPDGTTHGANTDCTGFRLSLEREGFSFAGRRVALLGAGGAARAVAVACLDAGCAALAVVNRTRARAEALVDTLRNLDGVASRELAACGGSAEPDAATAIATADLIVNATSIGLRPDDPAAVPQALLHPGHTVCDLMPIRRETATLAAAREVGARAVSGLGMLVLQGAAAFRIWTGREPDVAAMFAALPSQS